MLESNQQVEELGIALSGRGKTGLYCVDQGGLELFSPLPLSSGVSGVHHHVGSKPGTLEKKGVSGKVR